MYKLFYRLCTGFSRPVSWNSGASSKCTYFNFYTNSPFTTFSSNVNWETFMNTHTHTHAIVKASSGSHHSPQQSSHVGGVTLEKINLEEGRHYKNDDINSCVFKRHRSMSNSAVEFKAHWRGPVAQKREEIQMPVGFFFLPFVESINFLQWYENAECKAGFSVFLNADTMMGQWSNFLIQFLIFPSHVQHKKDEVCQIQNSIFVQYIFF